MRLLEILQENHNSAMKRIITLIIMAVCVQTLSAQTAPVSGKPLMAGGEKHLAPLSIGLVYNQGYSVNARKLSQLNSLRVDRTSDSGIRLRFIRFSGA